MTIYELDYVDIQRLAGLSEEARKSGRRVRVTVDGGLKVKVGEGVWTTPMGRAEKEPTRQEAEDFGDSMIDAAGWDPVVDSDSEKEAALSYGAGARDAWLVLHGMSPFG